MCVTEVMGVCKATAVKTNLHIAAHCALSCCRLQYMSLSAL